MTAVLFWVCARDSIKNNRFLGLKRGGEYGIVVPGWILSPLLHFSSIWRGRFRLGAIQEYPKAFWAGPGSLLGGLGGLLGGPGGVLEEAIIDF